MLLSKQAVPIYNEILNSNNDLASRAQGYGSKNPDGPRNETRTVRNAISIVCDDILLLVRTLSVCVPPTQTTESGFLIFYFHITIILDEIRNLIFCLVTQNHDETKSNRDNC